MNEHEEELQAMVSILEETIVQIGWFSRRRLEQEMSAFSLTAPQYIALRSIQRCGRGCSMSELAENAGQVSATMTGIIDRLAEAGLVRRERDPFDRRSLRVGLTPAGEQLLEEISARNRAWITTFLESLTPQERSTMVSLSGRYLEMIQQALVAA